jgi:acyl-CoA reductase-like NAD-dependent aldehyde dehydrogenase
VDFTAFVLREGMMAATAEEQTARRRTFESLDPASGEVVGEFPVDDAASAGRAVARAAEAARWWDALGHRERRKRLLRWKAAIVRYLPRLAELVHRETGKPVDDAKLEIILAIVHIDWAAKHARRVLGTHRVGGGLLAMNQAATLEYRPLGVVGVIGPWNYPVFTPMGSIAYALAAGNAVVFKPSEYTPATGAYLAELFQGVVPEQPVLQLLTGYGETGGALVGAGVDKVAFTGSARTAKKVAAACAERLTPLVAECGGKDALIVDADADLDAAADAAVWGAMSNAGQTCVGVERVYAVDAVYDAFVAKLAERAANVRAGDDREASYGPITMPGQLDVIQRHLDDALGRGARALVGGAESVHAPYVDPVVLTDVPEDAAANTEETFGPTMTVARVADLDDAVRHANATSYGLGATIFAKNKRRATEAARRIRSGMTSINAVIAFASVPALPFGGVGDSGYGRIHGADGLREFARPKAVTRQRFALPMNPASFTKSDKDMQRLTQMISLVHGRRR